jgi:hypothetical protein
MSSSLWKLEYGGSILPLAAWGIDYAVLTRRNLDADDLSLSVRHENIFTEPTFSYGGTITLWRGDVRWFKGTVTAIPSYGSSEAEVRRYTVSNAWWKLDRIIYQQPFFSKRLVGDIVVPTGGFSTRVVLGKDSWGNKLTADQQIQKISNYALSQGSGMFTTASLPTLPEPPMMEARDITCAEAIRRMVGFAPDCVGWFDYSSIVPVLYIQRRSSLGVVNLDLGNNAIVEVIDSLNPRHDLVPTGVVLVFLTSQLDESTGEPFIQEDRQVAGASTGEGVIFATIELALQGTDRAETPPAELASDYYDARSTLHWEGGLLLHERECSGLVRVGNRVNLLNGLAGWATMNAVVQSTQEDLFWGKTQITLGPPVHLSAQDFVGMMTQFRNRPAPTEFPGTQDNGSEGIPEPEGGDPTGEFGGDPDVPEGERTGNPNAGKPAGPGGSPGYLPALFPSVEMTKCVDGIEQTVRVVGVLG